MKVSRQAILDFLQERRKEAGGHTGEDLVLYAEEHRLNPHTFSRRVDRLLRDDPSFRGLIYLGKRKPSLSIEDYDLIINALDHSPLMAPTELVESVAQRRAEAGLPPVPDRSLRKTVQELSVGRGRDRQDPLLWFTGMKIPVALCYSLEEARRSLDDVFTYRDLTTHRGISLTKTLARFTEADRLFQTWHPGVSPVEWYEGSRPRAAVLPGLLASIHADRSGAVQARLAYEIQTRFLTECPDFLLMQSRARLGRFQAKINASLWREVSKIQAQRKRKNKSDAREALHGSPGAHRDVLQNIVDDPDDEIDVAKANLRLKRHDGYRRRLEALSTLTKAFTPTEITAQDPRAEVILRLARNEVRWADLPAGSQTALGKNRRLLQVENDPKRQEKLREVLLAERLFEYLQRGKLTLDRSWEYQDLGRLIGQVPLPPEESEWPLHGKVLDELLSDRYAVDIEPLRAALSRPVTEEDDEDEVGLTGAEDWSPLAHEIHRAVRAANPGWFEEHKRILTEVWDGCFRMEYDEEEFARNLVDAIGYLGRNCKLRQDPRFASLQHFIRRCVTPQTLEAELRFLHLTLRSLTGMKEEVLMTDTVGLEGWAYATATYHPRYGTLGVTDHRGMTGRMIPALSRACPSTETEAMHAVELVARSSRVLDGGIRIYAGNGHTVSRVSAGLLLGTFGVVSAGHVTWVPSLPPPGHIETVREHPDILNKVFLLMQSRPGLGRLFCSRSHVYVDGINVRQMVETVGCFVLRAVDRTGFSSRQVQPYIEASNRMKRVLNELERGMARARPHPQGLYLMSGEIILAMMAVRSCLRRSDETQPYPTIDVGSVNWFKPT